MAAMSATSALGGLGMIPGVRRQWGGKGGISTGVRARAAIGARAGVYAKLGEEKVGAIAPSRGAFTAAALALGHNGRPRPHTDGQVTVNRCGVLLPVS